MKAAARYETREEDLAKQFLAKWKEAEARMAADPEINRPFDGEFRKCRFKIFPYALIYRIVDSENLQVAAVMHLNRRPGYWKNRPEA